MTLSTPKFRILAIDGGGIRGVIPLQVIRYIESITNRQIHQCFDLIAGTSTGGILTSVLVLQDTVSVEANKRKYTLDEIENIYKVRGKDIFPIPPYSFQRRLSAPDKWLLPQFDPYNLNDILVSFLGDSHITDSLKPIFVASYDLHRNRPIYFTFREASISPDHNATLVEICRATSAAPTYFPTYEFNYAAERVTCIDGGIYMNNPSLGSLIEVLGNSDYKYYRLEDKPLELPDISILSLGTGYTHSLIDGQKASTWGRLKWIKPIIELSTNGPAKVIHSQMETIFRSFNLDNNYLRIDIHIDNSHSEMSDTRVATIDHLIDQTHSQVLNNSTMRLKIELFLKEAGLIN